MFAKELDNKGAVSQRGHWRENWRTSQSAIRQEIMQICMILFRQAALRPPNYCKYPFAL